MARQDRCFAFRLDGEEVRRQGYWRWDLLSSAGAQQPIYQKLGYNDSLLGAERASKEVLSLPVHPALGREDLDKIVEAVVGS